MLEESGRVVAVDGEDAWIAIERQPGCGSCSVRQGCGQGLLVSAGKTSAPVPVANRLGARLGDIVVIGVGESALLRAAVWMYLWPLLALLLGAGVASHLGASEGVVALSGMVALGSAFLILRVIQRAAGKSESLRPLMLRIISGA